MKTFLVVNSIGIDFEAEINVILKEYEAEDLIDIKYQDALTQYSALIIVKD